METQGNEVRIALCARIDQAQIRWHERCRPDAEAGLALYVFKMCTRPFIKRVVCVVYGLVGKSICVRCVAPLSICRTNINAGYRLVSDVYRQAIMDVALVAAYVIVYKYDTATMPYRGIVGIIVIVIAGFRVAEIVVCAVLLAMDQSYTISNWPRAIVNTIWHYGEIALAFAVIFLGIETINAMAFTTGADRALHRTFVTPIYASVSTLLTLGYGDIAPSKDSSAAMIAVCCEVISGALMMPIVLQTSIASINEKEPVR